MKFGRKQFFILLVLILIAVLSTGIYYFFIYSKDTNNSKKEIKTVEITPTPTIEPTPTVSPSPTPTVAPTQEPTIAPTPEPSTSNWWDYPSNISPVTKDPNNPLVLVNKKYQLPASYEPSDLTDTNVTGLTPGFLMRSVTINDLTELANAASAAGVNIGIQSTYRSFSNQEATYSYWLGYLGGDISATDQVSARAGHSQHQLGTALDFNSYEGGYLRLWQDFNITYAASWLKDNAWKYGFVLSYPEGRESETTFAYEGWHFRWIGKENASNWQASGEVLDVWLGKQ
jgi:D-alanyl-D-alanine carboxypeptidase